MFTRKTLSDLEWSQPKDNMKVALKRLDEPTLALLAGISWEKGREHFKIFDFSVNVAKFKEYIQEVRVTNGDDKICLYMDNLSAHRSKKSLACMREHGIRWVFNAVNSPDYNPIEYVFSKLK